MIMGLAIGVAIWSKEPALRYVNEDTKLLDVVIPAVVRLVRNSLLCAA